MDDRFDGDGAALGPINWSKSPADGDAGREAEAPADVAPATPARKVRPKVPAPDAATDESPRPPEDSDDALAERFAEAHRDDMRYVAPWGRWMSRQSVVWVRDETFLGLDRARRVCREAAASCNDVRLARSLASAATVAAVERLSKSDRRLVATVDQWDRSPWVLNTPGGVIDLRDGTRRPARGDDYMTKVTAVAPGGECRRWLAFLHDVAGGDADLIAFLQRMAGYCMTGITREHALFFLYGRGGNGKGTFVNTLAAILRDYAAVAPMTTLTAGADDNHPTDLAGLQGARLVSAQETDEGREWAEARIKALTGGDTIKARFMRQDFFEYVPQFKLLVSGNHKPRLRNVDDAMRRRLHLVPFLQRFDGDKRDVELSDKLHAEWPGILAWMVEGCRLWQDRGLSPPAAVTDATSEYFEAEDDTATWLAERTRPMAIGGTAAGVLFKDWTAWAKAAGEDPGSLKGFAAAMASRGFISRKRHGVMTYLGLGLAPAPDWQDSDR